MYDIDNKEIIIWGYGDFGKLSIKLLKEYNIIPKAIFDNDEEKRIFVNKNEDIRLCGPDELSEYVNDNSLIIICISREYIQEVKEQIESLVSGVTIINYQHLFNILAKRHYSNRNECWDIDYRREIIRWLGDFDNEFTWHEKSIKHFSNTDIERKKTINRFLNNVIAEDSVILDVGCGGLVKYTNKINSVSVDYKPIDVLQKMYEYAHKKYSFNVPNPISFAFAEHLSLFFDDDYADIVIAENSLDHAIDPLRCILEAFCVLKVGGIISLEHHTIEGMLGNGVELHKWDFFINDDQEFIIATDTNYINVSKLLRPYASVKSYEQENDCYGIDVIFEAVKERELPQEYYSTYMKKSDTGILLEELFNIVVLNKLESR